MQKRHFLTLAAIVLLATLIALNGSNARQQLMTWLGQETQTEFLGTNDCDLGEQPCTYALSETRSVTLSISPRPIKPIETLTVDVQINGVEARSLALDLAGTDMDMGFNQVPLTELNNGHFVGQTSIPVCTTGKMRWQATLLIDLPEKRLGIPFQFESGN